MGATHGVISPQDALVAAGHASATTPRASTQRGRIPQPDDAESSEEEFSSRGASDDEGEDVGGTNTAAVFFVFSILVCHAFPGGKRSQEEKN